MPTTWILYPMFALFILMLAVALRMLQLRIRAVKQDNLHPAYFKLNRGGDAPEYMLKAEQHYLNLFEYPVLFYVISILVYVLQFVDIVSVTLAWSFVVARIVHAYVHMGSNKIIPRLRAFVVSVVVLIALWAYVFIRLLLA